MDYDDIHRAEQKLREQAHRQARRIMNRARRAQPGRPIDRIAPAFDTDQVGRVWNPMSQQYVDTPEPEVTGQYECQESRAETPENQDEPGQTRTDPCGGSTRGGPGCTCAPGS